MPPPIVVQARLGTGGDASHIRSRIGRNFAAASSGGNKLTATVRSFVPPALDRRLAHHLIYLKSQVEEAGGDC